MNKIDELVDDIESFQEVDSLERGLASGKKYIIETDLEVCRKYREEARKKAKGFEFSALEEQAAKMKEILGQPLTEETLQKYGWGILVGDDEDDF